MNETLNLENATSKVRIKTPLQMLEERVARLEKAVFEEPTEAEAVLVINYLMETYELSVRTANCLRRAYGSFDAPKAKLERWLRSLVENNGEKLSKVPYLGNKSFKEVMDKVGNAK